MRNYWEEVIRQDPESLLAKIVRAMIPPEIPDFDIPPDCPNPDSLQMVLAYAFQRDHFFDGFAWADSSLLRTPILYNKLQQYVNQLLIQHPDSLIGPITRVIEESKANPSVFQYVTVYMLNHFMQSNIMGQDKVFVEIARRYYLSGEAFWASEEFLTNLRENVEKIVPNLIGATAHDLIMEDPSGEWHSLAQVRADYTVLYFWEPDCGHCKVSTPKLWDLYQKWRGKGLEVFAVYTQDNRQEWTDYLNEKGYDWINVYDPTNQSFFRFYYNVISTPTIYLLDRDKKIIAKRISVESLTEMVDRLMTGGRI